jgi:hypothetical protein
LLCQFIDDSLSVFSLLTLQPCAPKRKKDGVQLLPIGEVAAKDEFWYIKKVTVED